MCWFSKEAIHSTNVRLLPGVQKTQPTWAPRGDQEAEGKALVGTRPCQRLLLESLKSPSPSGEGESAYFIDFLKKSIPIYVGHRGLNPCID